MWACGTLERGHVFDRLAPTKQPRSSEPAAAAAVCYCCCLLGPFFCACVVSCSPRVQGSRVAFSNLHYYVYLRNGEGSKRSKRGGGVVGRAAAPEQPAAASRKEEAHVLRGVTGVVSPGQIMAIMGE